MNCQRCGRDTLVQQHEVDGFSGYLCESCREVWDTIQE